MYKTMPCRPGFGGLGKATAGGAFGSQKKRRSDEFYLARSAPVVNADLRWINFNFAIADR
jgi:hypothetical protein